MNGSPRFCLHGPHANPVFGPCKGGALTATGGSCTQLKRRGQRMQGGRASDDADLPKTLVRKIVKGKLAQVDAAKHASASDAPRRDVQLNKDALLAFSESAKVGAAVHCLTL